MQKVELALHERKPVDRARRRLCELEERLVIWASWLRCIAARVTGVRTRVDEQVENGHLRPALEAYGDVTVDPPELVLNHSSVRIEGTLSADHHGQIRYGCESGHL